MEDRQLRRREGEDVLEAAELTDLGQHQLKLDEALFVRDVTPSAPYNSEDVGVLIPVDGTPREVLLSSVEDLSSHVIRA